MELPIILESFYKEKIYDYNFPTELCNLMDKHGSDKGPNFKNSGNYTKFYDYLFRVNRDKINNVFEVGLGTNNIDVPSTMGLDGVPGASLRGWRDYFINAQIKGADIDKRILFTENRIETFFVDQHNTESILEMWKKINIDEFDIIIDDGIHDMMNENSGNINFFVNSINKLKKGGIYIIEDVAIEFTGEKINPKVEKFIQEVNNGYYKVGLQAILAKIPAYLGDKSKPTHCTQIITIKNFK